MLGSCHLCLTNDSDLQESHLVPRWAYKRILEGQTGSAKIVSVTDGDAGAPPGAGHTERPHQGACTTLATSTSGGEGLIALSWSGPRVRRGLECRAEPVIEHDALLLEP